MGDASETFLKPYDNKSSGLHAKLNEFNNILKIMDKEL